MSHEKKEAAQLFELLATQVTELSAMQIVHLLLHAMQQTPALRGDRNADAAPILGRTASPDQVGLLELVDEPRRIGIMGHHPGSNSLGKNAVPSGGRNNVQGVVLRIGNAVVLEELVEFTADQGMGTSKVQGRLLLGKAKGLELADLLLEVPWPVVHSRHGA